MFLIVASICDDHAFCFKELGRSNCTVADLAVFVSEHAHHAIKAAIAAGMNPDRVIGIPNLYEAAKHLKSELREGDLVLLRGRGTEHLSRICLRPIRRDRVLENSLWQDDCV